MLKTTANRLENTGLNSSGIIAIVILITLMVAS
jgi:hypothetical protein